MCILELISAHKKAHTLQEISSEVSTSSKSSSVNDTLSNTEKKESSSSLPHSSHRTATVTETSVLSVTDLSLECAHENHSKKISENVDKVATNSADDRTHKVLRSENDNDAFCSSLPSLTDDILSEDVSKIRNEMSKQKNNVRTSNVSAALAADMVNLYRSKVLANCHSYVAVSSSSCTPSAVSASSKSVNVRNRHSVIGVQLPDSSVVQRKRTTAAKIPLVSKNPFKLVKTKAVESVPYFGKSHLQAVSSQATAHFDKSACNITGKTIQSSKLIPSFSCLDSRPSSSDSTTRTVSYSLTMPKNLSIQLTPAVSSHLRVISNPSNCIAVSSSTNFVRGRNANTNVTVTASKYRLVRRRESTCKNTARQTYLTSLKDTSVNPFVAHRAAKCSPSLLVVNKYKLVRKKRRSLTLSAKKVPSDVKKTSPSMKLSHDVLSPLFRQPSASSPYSNSKARSSRYKLVRKDNQPCSTVVRKPVSLADSKVQMLSKYKIVRRKMLQMPQHATSTPVSTSLYPHSLCKKHPTPPIFLNKYKLIRKRALLKTNSSCCRRLRSPSITSRKPSAEAQQHLYSGKRHALFATSSQYKKRRTRKRSFQSKYALRRTGKGRLLFTVFCNVL